jgi:mRNA interferase MazF
MGAFVRGQVVVLPFPFSNLRLSLRRPALVLANGGIYDDLIVCMITAKPAGLSIEITDSDFLEGQLTNPKSYVRPDRLFTAEPTLVIRKAGTLAPYKMDEIMAQICRIFKC